jgi:hypothetical protein
VGESQNLQPSCLGSVAGAPCETAAADGAWGWHSGPYQATAARRGCGVVKHEEGRGFG